MAIEIVIVGMGARGCDWAREIRAAPAYKLVGCVDSDPQALARAETLQVPTERCFNDLATAIDRTDCRAVIVATSADCHVEPCEMALSRRRAVMVEKPFTLCLGEAAKLVSLAEQKGAPLLVAQNYRYLRSFRTAKRLLDEGALGDVGLVVCQYYRPPHDMAPSLRRLTHSVLWGMGVHHLDALRHVLQKEVIDVAAQISTTPWVQLPRGASLHAMLTFEGGTQALYSATYESSGHDFFERGQEFYLRLVGERATLHVFQRWLFLCERGRLPRLVRRGQRRITEEQVLLRQLERALLHNETPEVTGRDNLKTMAVLEACIRSATEQSWINPQELLNGSN